MRSPAGGESRACWGGGDGDIYENSRGISGGWRDGLQRQDVIKLTEGRTYRDQIMLEYNDRVKVWGRTERWILGFSICRLQHASTFL
jgi:hypothetical protein